MMNRVAGRREWLRAAVAGALGAGLAGCGGQVEKSDREVARVRLLNASTAYPALDLLIDDSRKNDTIAYGAAGDYARIDPGSVTTAVTGAGGGATVASSTQTLSGGKSYTVVAYGWQGAMASALLDEDTAAADSARSKLRVLNAATDAGSLDVYLTGATDALDSASPVAAGIAGGSLSSFSAIGAGSYRLRITAAGDKGDLRLDVSGLALSSTEVATLVVTPGIGGVLVHALLLVQRGSVTALANTLARARIVASVAGNAKVTASLGGATLMSAGTSPTIGAYAAVAAGTPALSLVVGGQPVSTQNVTLPAGSDATLLVWGDAAAPQLAVISDDNRLPLSSANAKLRLVQAVNGLASGLTLTADFSAIATDVLAGGASAYGNLAGASGIDLEVTSPLVTGALYANEATLAARGVYTLFMLGDMPSPTAALRKER